MTVGGRFEGGAVRRLARRGRRAASIAVPTLALCLATAVAAAPAEAARHGLSRVGHVFTIALENKDFASSFGPQAEAPYLANRLTAKGQLLTQYHGTGHTSLGNYVTMISGQSENPETQAGCRNVFDDVMPGTIGAFGQALGSGCVYPRGVRTVVDQLDERGLTWRGYMEDMGSDPARDGGVNCAHPSLGEPDATHEAAPADQYATRHNPFVYFHSVIDDRARCAAGVVNLARLRRDLRRPRRTRDFSFIVPDLCHNGHDVACADSEQLGGYPGIDAFLKRWVPRILRSRAYRRDGALIITFDESESDASACCFVPDGPNVAQQGIYGPGGGLTGTVVISPFTRRGSVNGTPYNHYDYLRTVEDVFGLGHLAYAAHDGVRSFGRDVFARRRARRG